MVFALTLQHYDLFPARVELVDFSIDRAIFNVTDVSMRRVASAENTKSAKSARKIVSSRWPTPRMLHSLLFCRQFFFCVLHLQSSRSPPETVLKPAHRRRFGRSRWKVPVRRISRALTTLLYAMLPVKKTRPFRLLERRFRSQTTRPCQSTHSECGFLVRSCASYWPHSTRGSPLKPSLLECPLCRTS